MRGQVPAGNRRRALLKNHSASEREFVG
jgi:hypothetical protein